MTEFNLSEKEVLFESNTKTGEKLPMLYKKDVKIFIKKYDVLFSQFLIRHKKNDFHLDADDLFHHFVRPEEFIKCCETCKDFIENRNKLLGDKFK